MTRRRTLWVGATFLSLLVALGAAQAQLERTRRRRPAGTVEAPRFEVDPFWPKPLPNHWVLGRRSASGSTRRITSGSSIATRRRSATNEKALRAEPPTATAARGAPPVLEFDHGGQPRRPLGRPGRGLRLAAVEPRHHHRPQGQRLDRRQRRRATRRS